jgi:Fe-S oxidoreductase
VSLVAAISKTKAYLCLECGICTGSCPVSRYNQAYSPRMTVERALLFAEDESLHDAEMWSCLTCGTCNLRCPSTVDFTAFMRTVREKARKVGETGVCTHADTLSAITELQMSPGFQRSDRWLGRRARTRSRGDTYYFGGCLPFLGVVFADIGFQGKRIGEASVRLLNRLGITPAVSGREVCCGHDQYWTGETDIARELASRNVEAIRRTGAKRVVFSCPECYNMFKTVYPSLVGDPGFEPVLILDILEEGLGSRKLRSRGVKVTYHDPCRLAKADDRIDQPRDMLRRIPDLELIEMPRAGKDAVCCGSSNWVSCTRVNKLIQVERLDEAISTGAGMLVTACPKCNIHLRCAMRDGDCSGEIDIEDLVTLIADSLGGGKRGT